MRTVSLREANQNFSSCVAEVERGERLVVLRRGKPVAQLIPYAAADSLDPAQEQAVRELSAFLKTGLNLKGVKVKREELYDRGR